MYKQTDDENNNGWILWLVLLVAYSAFIYYLSSGPIQVPIPRFPYVDKILHVGAYGLMALLAWQTTHRWMTTHQAFWAWLYTGVYGATDEWHQYYVPGRNSDVWDWVADVTGATLVLVLLHIVITIQQKRAWKEDTEAPL